MKSTISRFSTRIGILFSMAVGGLAFADSGPGWVHYPGGEGPGKGKHVVLLAGDEEYRSEESMPMMAKILSQHHGFECTVLFSTDEDGVISPNTQTSLGKPEALDQADAIVMSLRFRKWPAEAFEHFDGALKRAVPVIALRTSTHAFQVPGDHPAAKFNNFGKDVLGETWVSHWGQHKAEATRGVINPEFANQSILNGVKDVFGDTDVYEAHPPEDAIILMHGQVLSGMDPESEPASYEKKNAKGETQGVNDPMMPVAWQRVVAIGDGNENKVFCTTMGSATDLENEGLRRLIVNAVFWGIGMDPLEKADVSIVGEFKATDYGFDSYKNGMKASDFELTEK